MYEYIYGVKSISVAATISVPREYDMHAQTHYKLCQQHLCAIVTSNRTRLHRLRKDARLPPGARYFPAINPKIRKRMCDKSEIRTHAPYETTMRVFKLKPERGALDRSAILPYVLKIAVVLALMTAV